MFVVPRKTLRPKEEGTTSLKKEVHCPLMPGETIMNREIKGGEEVEDRGRAAQT